MGPRVGLDILEKRKILACAGIWTLAHPAHGIVTGLLAPANKVG